MWNIVKNDQDIEKLMNEYGRFHDSCIVSINYMSGAYVDDNKAMNCGNLSDRKLTIIVHRQWDPVEIEMKFNGVRKFNIKGWLDNYFCDIYGAYLSFHTELLGKTRDDKLIVWADDVTFNPVDYVEDKVIDIINYSYIIADELKWRFINTK